MVPWAGGLYRVLIAADPETHSGIDSARLVKELGHAREVKLEGCGQYVQYDRPDAVIEAIKSLSPQENAGRSGAALLPVGGISARSQFQVGRRAIQSGVGVVDQLEQLGIGFQVVDFRWAGRFRSAGFEEFLDHHLELAPGTNEDRSWVWGGVEELEERPIHIEVVEP